MAIERLELASRPPLTVDEYEALALAEGWDEDTRLELLDGEVVPIRPINDPHIGCVNRLNRLFSWRFAEDVALIWVQHPIRIERYDEPQPDVALLKPRADDDSTAKATPADVLLLVEVADRTLRTDLGRKARIYATGGVREYWVVDVTNHCLYVHRVPADGKYTSRHLLGPDEHINPECAPGLLFSIAEVAG